MQKETNISWYRTAPTDASTPFTLWKSISSTDSAPFFSTSAFPWHINSLNHLFNGAEAGNDDLQSKWKEMIKNWQGSFIVGSRGCALVFRGFGGGEMMRLTIPGLANEKTCEVKCVAWGLDYAQPSHPLAIFSVHSVLYIFDLATGQPIGRLRGHGGEITSIAMHPRDPYIFLSTSKDMTVRLYDLAYNARQKPNNSHWPPGNRPSLAGPAFGLHMSESEGDGVGRCLAVLVGGRAGGHEAAVFHAAWHPTADLIATCGMDRMVKIWRMPQIDHAKVKIDSEHLAREDKPLFSTDLIHNARVLSIAWLTDDTLVSYSAPALMGNPATEDFWKEPGTVAIWTWLGFDRYLPRGMLAPMMRGNQNDYQNSKSFKLISVYTLPMSNPMLHFYTPFYKVHDPLILVPSGDSIRIFNIVHFKPRPTPPAPRDPREAAIEASDRDTNNLVAHADRITIRDDAVADNELDGHENDALQPGVLAEESTLEKLCESVKSHILTLNNQQGSHTPSTVERCEVAFGGNIILGIGKGGPLFIWRLKSTVR